MFFGSVANDYKSEEYVKAFRIATKEQLLDELLAQAHAKSKYLDDMFRWVQRSLLLTGISILLNIIFLFFIAVSLYLKNLC